MPRNCYHDRTQEKVIHRRYFYTILAVKMCAISLSSPFRRTMTYFFTEFFFTEFSKHVLMLCAVVCTLGGIAIGSLQCTPTPSPTMTLPQDTLIYLALGDSYTIAEGLAAKDSWAVQLAALVRGRGVYLQDPLIIARTGWRTDQLMNAVRQAQNSMQITPAGYDVLTLLIGVNNQYQGGSEDLFRAQFSSLLRMSITMARGKASRVVVLSIPDYSVTPFAASLNTRSVAAAIDRFNAVKREECTKAGVAFVDITPLSREALNRRSFLASDSLHPSREQYAAWANLALPVVLEVLRK